MNDITKIQLPDAVLAAMSEGKHIIRAYREFLGYSVEELAVACGLSIEEIDNIEAGRRYDKGYRERIARSLSLPENTFSVDAA
ncbi:helix-turn-helix domain-containing protein [Chelativorans salis]|uniref:Helix-turn-helix transcriptional regulator n=1 Tax=Chelativorans salis TaxID=2978478 RepID=A0ABT2LS60_9HYPH|nr:helix-turn-helix transcriptional regulator [Chelativorans sp. EGI FJ00035]MCT7377206.1 helix-turn-helix transcriptional regulator [Chelativorans sp. EGI FJ00035]